MALPCSRSLLVHFSSRSLQQAIAHHRAERLEQAERQYRAVLRMQSRQPDAIQNLGLLLLQRGRVEEALPFLKRMTAWAPSVGLHWLRYIDALLAADRQGEARLAIGQAQGVEGVLLDQRLQRASQPSPARLNRLFEIYRRGDALVTEIAAWLFVEEFPTHPLGAQVLGAVLHDSGKFDEALAVRQQTAEDFLDDANVHNNLAQSLLALHRFEEALVCARRALEIDPGLAEARGHEVRALAGMGVIENNLRPRSKPLPKPLPQTASALTSFRTKSII